MTPSPTPGQQVTGNEADEFQAFVRQAIQEEIAKGTQPGTQVQATPTPQPISVNLNGQTFQFQNQEELNRALTNTFSAYNTELANLRNSQVADRGAEVTGTEEAPKFSMDTFVQKMQANPVEAFDYVDQIRYGFDNPVEAVKSAITARSELADLQRVMAVYQFKDAHPEYEGNPQTANTMYQIMDQAGLPFTIQGLEAAYSVGLLRGMIPLPQQFQAQPRQGEFNQNPYSPQQTFNPSPYAQYAGTGTDPRQFNGGFQTTGYPGQTTLAPPQSPRFAAEASPDLASLAQDMSPEQIEAVFARLQR